MASPPPPPFVPGLELSRRFYAEAVRPLLDEAAPGIPHSAARIGSGSEVLGFDTPRSADHEWGPRLTLFLHPEDAARHGARVSAFLSERLPKTFRGYPTNFELTGEDVGDTRWMRPTDGPVHHRVEITDAASWFTATLGFDPSRPGGRVTLADWLATPTQRLAEVTAGAVFHDGLDRLAPARARLRWYPHDVWLYLLACQWRRVSQEEAFTGRCGEVGDDLGSAVVAARLVRDLMRLCLLMDRRYPPYTKWLGSAFARTPHAPALTPALSAALAATDWHTRERHLAHAYETVAAAHNALALTDPVDPTTRPYHSRPFRVLHAERFADALTARVADPAIRALPPIGAVDQYLDNTDVLTRPALARAWHDDLMSTETRHIAQPIARPAGEVYAYASDPSHIAEWASGLGTSVEEIDGQWFAETPQGRVAVTFTPINEYGVLDHDVTLPTGETVHNAMRVLPDGDGCEVVFTLRRRPGMTDDDFEQDAAHIAADLTRLRQLMEHGTP